MKLGGRCIVQKFRPSSNLGVTDPWVCTPKCGVRLRRWENQHRLSGFEKKLSSFEKNWHWCLPKMVSTSSVLVSVLREDALDTSLASSEMQSIILPDFRLHVVLLSKLFFSRRVISVKWFFLMLGSWMTKISRSTSNNSVYHWHSTSIPIHAKTCLPGQRIRYDRRGFMLMVTMVAVDSPHRQLLYIKASLEFITRVMLLMPSSQFQTVDTDKTKLSCLVLSVSALLGGVNWIGDKSRLSETENFETEHV